MTVIDPVTLSLFSNRMSAICEEMGVVLARSAFSSNIKDRQDFSCALFDPAGGLIAQAAHIPVHLGSMAFAMADIVQSWSWQPGQMVVLNDPYMGGTHLPDVTVIAPLYEGDRLVAFAVNRAHHANIGADSPGSMPLSTTLQEEGLVISPSELSRDGHIADSIRPRLVALGLGDFEAQISANLVGLERLQDGLSGASLGEFRLLVTELNKYGERMARSALYELADGCYSFTDYLDDDGQGQRDIQITATVTISGSDVTVDFTGTAAQVAGNVNCPLAVAAAATYYVFRCLMPITTPSCAGVFAPVKLTAPKGCLVNANSPAAVSAGNVETSTRIVDVVMGALQSAAPGRLAAASQGSMNNVAMGARGEDGSNGWDYYETLGGGMGASAMGPGLGGVQCHMTNTLNTPIEALEMQYPLRITRYQLRNQSGGNGVYAGGEGIVREYQFLEFTQVTLLTERRERSPWGCAGGGDGMVGENRLNGEYLPGKWSGRVAPGDKLSISSPGGGGWGRKQE